ncbi:response regulator transcription factor [Paenibacillus sp. SYP-B3998]|uniref:Response regulator transcription factor n=1 Tax=Paenibacillus sp. SYP-B3998 TaxID=2678564 RepID=A0A6G3ZTU2_9BACL|nr:response regulator transcription factor [Paenibacillus sp. SYP-B3998]NEW05009.1 response regulator transcription factor [Paenibacillus sp. SYP-B3998]
MWKLVVVDDDYHILQGFKKAIAWDTLGIEWVGEAENGQDGYELIVREKPDIVLTDIYMPQLNGLEMIERLRSEGIEAKYIVLSGYSDFEYARKALRLNVADYLSKPVTLDDLKQVLNKVLDTLHEEIENRQEFVSLTDKISMYEPFVQKQWLRTLISGATDPIIHMQLPEAFLSWDQQRHFVMAVELLRTPRIRNASMQDWYLFRFAVGNVIKELLAQHWPDSQFIEIQSSHMMIVLHRESEAQELAVIEQITNLGHEMVRCMETYLQLQVRVGVGSPRSAWREISDSAEEAFQVLSTEQVHSASVQFYSQFKGTQSEGTDVLYQLETGPVKFFQILADSLRYMQMDQARQIALDFFGQFENRPVDYSYMRNLGLQLWAVLGYALNDLDHTIQETYPMIDIQKEMEHIYRYDQLEKWLLDKLEQLYGNRVTNENPRHKEAVEFMIQYIHEHYAEDITLETLANKIFISRNYLNKIFKKTTGETFMNYLIRVRMEKAELLLLQGKWMIYEVAEQVGYSIPSYFSTVFKKYTGKNPSDLMKERDSKSDELCDF